MERATAGGVTQSFLEPPRPALRGLDRHAADAPHTCGINRSSSGRRPTTYAASLGGREAVRVTVQVLKDLMRYESVETTTRYCVGRNAQTTTDAIWAAYGRTTGSRQEAGENFEVDNKAGNAEAVCELGN
jgi:hypothetical protein